MVRVKREEDKTFMRLQISLVLGSTLSIISLLFFPHYSKMMIPPLSDVNRVSGLAVDLSETGVVGTGD